MNEEQNYLERIAYLAYYFFEIDQDVGGDGHSVLIKLLNPVPEKVEWKQLRSETLTKSVRNQRLGLTEAALETACWLRSAGLAPTAIQNEATQLRTLCGRYVNTERALNSVDEKNDRRSLRLVRILWLMHENIVGQHSRALQFFFPDSDIFLGRTDAAPDRGYHPEHVVPCAYIRDTAFNYFRQQPLVKDGREDSNCARELAGLLKRLMHVVHISKEQAKILDSGDKAMRSCMPPGWDPLTGDILARLQWPVTRATLLN